MSSESNQDREQPTLMRYAILGLLCLAASVAYLCRNSLGVAESTIRDQLDLSPEAMGWVMSTFFLAYALGQIPMGWLGARLGSRRGISLFAAAWSLATAALGLAFIGFAVPILVAARVSNGLAQAGLFPASTASIGRWFPDTRRAVASGSLASFMSVGGAAGTAMTGYLITGFSWQAVFLGYGLIGLVFAVLFHQLFRNSPADHSWVNEAETRLILERRDDGKPSPSKGQESEAQAGDGWRVLAQPQAWWICGQQACRAAGQIFFASWFATYLQETRAVSVAGSGVLNSLPLLAIVVGAFVGGAVSDFVLHISGSRRVARSGVAFACMTACAVFVCGAYFIEDAVLAVGAISLGTFCAAVGGPCAYTVTIDMGGRHVAILFATMNMIGNLGAFAFIQAAPQLIKFAGWDAVLGLFVVLHLAAALFWALIRPDQSLDQGDSGGK